MNERTEDIKERFAKLAYEYAVVSTHEMAMKQLERGDRLPTSRYREWKKTWDGLSGEQKSFVSSLIFDVASSSAHGFASILEGSLVELEEQTATCELIARIHPKFDWENDFDDTVLERVEIAPRKDGLTIQDYLIDFFQDGARELKKRNSPDSPEESFSPNE